MSYNGPPPIRLHDPDRPTSPPPPRRYVLGEMTDGEPRAQSWSWWWLVTLLLVLGG